MRAILVAIVAVSASCVRVRDAQSVACPGDLDRNGSVSISELVSAVKSSVDGCPLPGRRFVDNQDGTITDNRTGRCGSEEKNSWPPCA